MSDIKHKKSQPAIPKYDIGTYVLAMKWNDGDPFDHWAVGFYAGLHEVNKTRHMVVDNDGQNFRGNGFRRVHRISAKRGHFLVQYRKEIQGSGASLLFWLRSTEREREAFIEAFSI